VFGVHVGVTAVPSISMRWFLLCSTTAQCVSGRFSLISCRSNFFSRFFAKWCVAFDITVH